MEEVTAIQINTSKDETKLYEEKENFIHIKVD